MFPFLFLKNYQMKIILTEINGKMAFKKGENGYCYTFNKNEKSRRKAYENALKSKTNEKKQRKNI